jgi:hypothetical protein
MIIQLGMLAAPSVHAESKDISLELNVVAESKDISIELNVVADSVTANLSATAFGISLAGWVLKNEDIDMLPLGIYQPSADAYLDAFSSQIQIWRELRAKGEGPYDYLDQLVQVDDGGYLLEYVWRFHSARPWGDPPPDLDVESFSSWFPSHIAGHEPRLEAQLRVTSK